MVVCVDGLNSLTADFEYGMVGGGAGIQAGFVSLLMENDIITARVRGLIPTGTNHAQNACNGSVRRFGCKRPPNGTSMLHSRDRESCNPPLKHVLNSANDPVITHEDIICKLQASGRD